MKEPLVNLPFTVENIKKFIERYPKNGASAPWGDMLFEDADGMEYTLDDYREEIEQQVAEGDIPPRSAAKLCEVFPHTFFFDEGDEEE